jgi:acetyl esterase/lipase
MPEDKYPAAVEDAFCALAWMHTHAFEYNLDPDRFVVLGHSSGGTLAAMLGVVDNPEFFLEGCPHQIPDNDWIKGVITFTGIFDYPFAAAESDALTSYINAYLGADQIADPDIWNEASPIAYVDGTEPPFLVIHGEADQNIDPRQSMEFVKALDVAGVRTQLLIIPDLDHPGIVWNEIALTEVEKFLAMLIDT